MHILYIGAHPDDCDFSVGGSATLFARRGDRVKFVSVTNGDRGHMAEEYRQDRTRQYGIGLALVSEVISRHSGTVTAANPPEGGAVFRIILPSAPTRG